LALARGYCRGLISVFAPARLEPKIPREPHFRNAAGNDFRWVENHFEVEENDFKGARFENRLGLKINN
jgi:hypothetical protein